PTLDEPHYFRAMAFAHFGLLERVEPEVRLALKTNPRSSRARGDATQVRGLVALYSGNYGEAERLAAEFDRLLKRRVWRRPMALFYLGDRARSEVLLEEAIRSGLGQ